jgi:gliding motility-associated-like protein
MKPNWLKFVAILFAIIGCSQQYSFSQTCRRSDINGTTINLLCNQVCTTLVFKVPHIKQTSNYLLTTIPFAPYAFTTPTGTEVTSIYVDDTWTAPIPSTPQTPQFNFCYYGNLFQSLLMGSNSALTFDITRAGMGSGYIINAGGTIPSTSYAPNMIFGPYHDIDPSDPSTNKKIEWRIECEAPFRRFIASYNDMPYFGVSCPTPRATHQIVLYEGSGIIEVYIKDKPSCTAWNGGRAILGIQDGTRTNAVSDPTRNATVWDDINTAYRFTPSDGTSRYVSSQIYVLGGALIANADTATTTQAMLDLSFPNICVPAGSNQYEIVTTFQACDNPANLLVTRDTITVSRTNSLGATNTVTNTSCELPNGSITVNVPAGVGTAPFSYVLDGGTPVVTPSLTHTFTNVAAGAHIVTITDATTGCTTTLNVTVNLIGNLTATTNALPVGCATVTNGSITVTPTNGTGPYSYSLNGATPVSGPSPYTFTNLPPGNYTITVTDATGCFSNPLNVTVGIGAGLTGHTVTSAATSCAGASNGVITVTSVTGGSAPYEYQINGGPFQLSNVFTGLIAGTYNITIRDAVGCTRNFTRTVASGTSVTATRVLTGTSCPNAADGAITISPTNGTGPYEFSIDGGPFVAGAVPFTFSGLTAGAHSFVIRDVPTNCLSFVINFTIAAGPAINGNAVQGSTSCSGASNGTITVTPTTGTGPWEFSLDGAPYVAGASPHIFTNVPAGAHTVTIRNVAGCESNSINVNVQAGPSLVTTASKTDVLCNATATGSITVAQPSAGTPPFEYSLDATNWQTANQFTNLPAGVYTVYYREANGCQNTLSITVDEPMALAASSAMVPVVCNGQSNGTVTVTAAGGVGPYQYSSDGGVTWQTNNVFNLPAGSYNVWVRDFNGCQRPQTVVVSEPAVLTASSLNSNASCNGGNDGTILISTAGGNAGFSYSIDGVTFQSANQFNVAPGAYMVTVRDNLGCTNTFPATVGLTDDLVYTRQTDPTICESKSVQLNFASNATQYSWAPATALSSTTVANPVANPVVNTQYIVTATFGRCNVQDTVVVNVNAAPVPNAGADGFICYGQTYTLNASGGVQYKWSPSTYLSNSNIPNPISTPAKDIVYTVSILADANGCGSLLSDSMRIDVTPPIKIRTFPFDTVVYEYDTLPILAIASDTDVINYSWSPAFGLNNAAINNPIVTAGSLSPAMGTGPYGNETLYTVTGSTIAGCKGEGYVKVRIYKGPDLYLPTGFTPNGDGKNDRLIPFPVGIKELRYFRIYNRYGQLVFSTNQLHQGWDGRIGGIEQQSASFVWMAEAVTEMKKVITKKGVVTLIR